MGLAAFQGRTYAVKALLKLGAKTDRMSSTPNSPPSEKASPLAIAAHNGHLEVLEALAEANADVDQTTARAGATPLVLAALNGHLHIVNALLKRGAEVLTRTASQHTALSVALAGGYDNISEAILEHEMDQMSK